ncbi:tol-pal system-associated acyl-CoA thioesterase [Ectothiorhodospira marina]|uniref:tol-pal system-associated acyl-CoA thioesterase n=1 Tax=Ectothiorhodospira marina TaxID=1396821 RepID=UPI000B7C5C25|nr:tol-pal system-associated acyl-CoA thioesterase [Ectothiorhodospira marina]
MSPAFRWPLRVYYEDTDAGGVVFYANYLKFMERARTEWLRELGFEQQRLMEAQGVMFAVRSAQLDYLRPAILDDALTITSQVVDQRRASLRIHHEVWRGSEGDAPELLCRGEVKIACLDARQFTPRPIPDNLAALMHAGDPQ